MHKKCSSAILANINSASHLLHHEEWLPLQQCNKTTVIKYSHMWFMDLIPTCVVVSMAIYMEALPVESFILFITQVTASHKEEMVMFKTESKKY